MSGLSAATRILALSLMLVFMPASRARDNVEKDPHRPACTSARCLMVRSFLKLHYCGDSPFGNGPDDGCEIKTMEKPGAGADVIADYKCEWNEKKGTADCKQNGELPSAIRDILVAELHRAGLPAKANGQTYFTLWKSSNSHWSLAVAYYSLQIHSELDLCEVLAVIDHGSHVVLVHRLPFTKTDVDVPNVTQWAPLDIADVEGNGHDEIVLEGDQYENHWLEVVTVHDATVQTIFSGLGYYL